MKKLTKPELLGIAIIFLILFIMSLPNFILSVKRARDNTRKGDLGALVYSLGEYQKDMLSYPLSTDGKITACITPGDNIKTDEKGRIVINFIPCYWGVDGLFDPRDSNAYMSVIPNDPDSAKGSSYLYFSNGRRFQIYAALEAIDDDQYDKEIVKRNLMCGVRVCNTGRSDGETPLNISLEEYEESLQPKF